MNRRLFLQLLGVSAASVAVPSLRTRPEDGELVELFYDSDGHFGPEPALDACNGGFSHVQLVRAISADLDLPAGANYRLHVGFPLRRSDPRAHANIVGMAAHCDKDWPMIDGIYSRPPHANRELPHLSVAIPMEALSLAETGIAPVAFGLANPLIVDLHSNGPTTVMLAFVYC